ncbi:uncharacterized protein LOC123512834 isoform X1 [Portunus trituberculatus]|uniref:uncharacterized protein LOC123512834 isoform X1 n=1 Tax=Portunus trituberculatus TaxID=210409 RepID=UPI001E1D1CDA|nr:uncharacterized protein LOC123512834 isoform X1 [Portunus trituberculatus]
MAAASTDDDQMDTAISLTTATTRVLASTQSIPQDASHPPEQPPSTQAVHASDLAHLQVSQPLNHTEPLSLTELNFAYIFLKLKDEVMLNGSFVSSFLCSLGSSKTRKKCFPL